MKNRRFLIFTGVLCALLLTAGLLAVRGHRVVPLPEPHPEDFSPHISPTELAALGGDPEIASSPTLPARILRGSAWGMSTPCRS